MRIVALLILWSLPSLQTGGYEASHPTGSTARAHAENVIIADVIGHARGDLLPSDPISGMLAEDDDSLEDGSVDLGL